jgi:hypothetical protein
MRIRIPYTGKCRYPFLNLFFCHGLVLCWKVEPGWIQKTIRDPQGGFRLKKLITSKFLRIFYLYQVPNLCYILGFVYVSCHHTDLSYKPSEDHGR